MVKADEARNIVDEYTEEVKKQEHEKVVEFCEKFSASIVHVASKGRSDTETFIPTSIKVDDVIKYLEGYGYTVRDFKTSRNMNCISVSW